jgi:hypothetical protein
MQHVAPPALPDPRNVWQLVDRSARSGRELGEARGVPETRCGTVWGHTGNTAGYTQFMAASPNGKRSATVSINSQLNPTVGDPEAFEGLRSAEESAVCAALADKG